MIDALKLNSDRLLFYMWLALMAALFMLSSSMV